MFAECLQNVAATRNTKTTTTTTTTTTNNTNNNNNNAGASDMGTIKSSDRIAATLVFLRSICINILHEGDSIFTYNNNDDDDDNNNKRILYLILKGKQILNLYNDTYKKEHEFGNYFITVNTKEATACFMPSILQTFVSAKIVTLKHQQPLNKCKAVLNSL
jgi:hypothetical protein